MIANLLVEPGAGADRRPRRNEVREFYANHFVSQIRRTWRCFLVDGDRGELPPVKALSAERTGPQQIG